MGGVKSSSQNKSSTTPNAADIRHPIIDETTEQDDNDEI